jgi:hypothetical protein
VAGGLAAPNLITGSSFEIDTNGDGIADGCVQYASGTTGAIANAVVTPGAGAVHGAKVQRVTAHALGTSTADQAGVRLPSVAVQPGVEYVLSAYALASAACQVRVYWDWRDGATSIIGAPASAAFAASTSGWVRHSVSAVAPANAVTASPYVWMQAAASAGLVQINIDAAQFEVGTVPTPYAGFATLQAHDFLACNNQLLPVAYAGAVANDAGAATVPLSRPLQRPLTAGQAVVWQQPTGLFQLVSSELDFSHGRGRWQRALVLPFREVFA